MAHRSITIINIAKKCNHVDVRVFYELTKVAIKAEREASERCGRTKTAAMVVARSPLAKLKRGDVRMKQQQHGRYA
ncbi:hypothetical protein L596_021599 [Steinernema carpocapsae]|uniref:Uncharacterized protein n=1 Tax=Steinernema carpocapsae TaxID=34508 RepID=A0A4U5MJ84_STECR|nr:hypothetical protein L596_021599 [Steinernema carpocapsae]